MKTYTYFDDGSLETVTSGGQTVASYDYTPAGLLASAEYKDKSGNTRTLINTWDASSNRVRFSIDDGQDPPPCNYYEFVYDPTAGIPAVLQENKCAPGAVYYIREPGGGLIARSTPGGIHYYHFDELGSTRLLTNSSGEVTDRYTYDAYGSVLSHDGYTGSVDQPYQYVGQLGYYTHYMEPDFGLLQLGVRFYDPEVGRFTQRDPVARWQVTSYGYANGLTTRLVDPSGKIPVVIPIVVGMACVGHCKNCMLDQADYAEDADEKFRKEYDCGEDTGDDEGNAVKHCVWACMGRKICGYACARTVVSCWEAKGIRRRHRLTCGMDLVNDDEGLASAKDGGRCYDRCVEKLKAGKLIHLRSNCKRLY